ncbi:MAG: MazG nucleotide pyrophosphohydrolase domain-containing protein [Candidatus Methanomethylicia archaeon]
MQLSEVQQLIKEIYFNRDRERGIEKTFIWFVEEVGEFAKTLKKGSKSDVENELADVFAWLLSLANLLEIDLENAFTSKYNWCCPRCKQNPCKCPME